jgi:hypothetical protein
MDLVSGVFVLSVVDRYSEAIVRFSCSTFLVRFAGKNLSE